MDNYDYATTLEEIGGKMFAMPESTFRELNNAASTKEQRKRERREEKAHHAALESLHTIQTRPCFPSGTMEGKPAPAYP